MLGKIAELAVVGVGNTLAGDDGAGIAVLEGLRKKPASGSRILLIKLEGDLFGIDDWLRRAKRFIFIDAIIGGQPGEIVTVGRSNAAFASSLHQTDIGTVMRTLQFLKTCDPFPEWEIWGITILFPGEIGIGLSSGVERAVAEVVRRIEQIECQ